MDIQQGSLQHYLLNNYHLYKLHTLEKPLPPFIRTLAFILTYIPIYLYRQQQLWKHTPQEQIQIILNQPGELRDKGGYVCVIECQGVRMLFQSREIVQKGCNWVWGQVVGDMIVGQSRSIQYGYKFQKICQLLNGKK